MLISEDVKSCLIGLIYDGWLLNTVLECNDLNTTCELLKISDKTYYLIIINESLVAQYTQ